MDSSKPRLVSYFGILPGLTDTRGMSTIHDKRYIALIGELRKAREARTVTQVTLAQNLNQPQSYVAKVEGLERRLDIIELFDWLAALKYESLQFFRDIGWFPEEGSNPSSVLTPIEGDVKEVEGGICQKLLWEGQVKEVLLEGITAEQYLRVERQISQLFKSLNVKRPLIKNREAIVQALELAIREMPNLNPSDIYHHIVYRIYLRDYTRSTAEQSWVRAGGEAMELFIEKHYTAVLAPHGIYITALLSSTEKAKALSEMGLSGKVGDSKLDVALYGEHEGEKIIFGGVHSKASLAERVSDDVPCSEAMMREGLVSYLYTFDAKSFPPPHGDLINRGELGSHTQPSDKRRYIEEHGSFDACFSYNLRTSPSFGETPSGKRIYASSLKREEDVFPIKVIGAWNQYKKKL